MQMPSRPIQGQPLAASWGIQILDYLRSITPRSSASVRVRTGAGGTTYEVSARPASASPVAAGLFPWHLLAFGYALDLAWDEDDDEYQTTCTIYPGTVRIHGITEMGFADDEAVAVTLTGTPCMVYLQYARPAGGIEVQVANPDPETGLWPRTNSSHVTLPLYIFDGEPPEPGEPYLRYRLARICHMGDFNFDTPIR